jgi:hypothetical protein
VADEHELPRLAGAPALEASGAPTVEPEARQFSLQSRISSAMVGMKKEYYGKGPERAKTFINDEYVFVVMEGGLTRNEQTLLAAGQHDLVRSYRLRFQEAVTATTVGASAATRPRRRIAAPARPVAQVLAPVEVAVLVRAAVEVRLAAAALGEAAADHVAGGDDRDVQPGLARDELVGAVGVAALDHRGTDEDHRDDGDERHELGRLQAGLGLG